MNHKARQRARIIHAALQLIAADGLSRLTISRVAEQAGLTRQTVYNYFPDVEGIIASAMEEHDRAMAEHLLGVIHAVDGPLNQFTALATFQIRHAAPQHSSLELSFVLSPELREQIAHHTDSVKAALVAGWGQGSPTRGELDPAAATELLWGFVQGAVEAAIRHPDQRDALLEALLDAIASVLVATD